MNAMQALPGPADCGRLALLSSLVMLFFLQPGSGLALHPDELYGQKNVGVSDLSPGGRFLLYTISNHDLETGRNSTTMLRYDFDGGSDIVIFTPEDNCDGAVWSPDSQSIAYRRYTDEGTEIWLMAADGSGRHRISEQAGVFGDLVWAPDGTALAYFSSSRTGAYAGRPGEYVVADHIGFRHLNAGYREGKLNQLFVLDLYTGRVRRLFSEPIDVRSLSWSPDSRQLVFSAKRRADLGINLNADLWIVSRAGDSLRQLTTNGGPDTNPRWLSADRISYLRTEDPLWEACPVSIAVIDPEVGDRQLLENLAGDFGQPYWRYASTGDGFVFVGANEGSMDLYLTTEHKYRRLTRSGCDFWDCRVENGRIVLLGTDQQTPNALYTLELPKPGQTDLVELKILLDPNIEWRRQTRLAKPEPFSVVVEGRPIHGWYFLPPDMGPDQRVPTVLSIHGGPEWMYGGYFLPEFHILPTYGYAVLIANPTGSMGYGVEFLEGIRGDWIGRPARELLACVDWAVEQGWADPDRLAVMGGSYGGHLAAALTTQTDRFRAAAVDRMHPDLVGFWGTTDEKWFPEWEFSGRPWESPEIYRANSPFTRVDQVHTPTLISQGMYDYRCLIAGGESWFSALKVRGVPTRFIRFENEGHGIRRRNDLVFYHNQLLEWFEQYVLRGDEDEHE